MKKITILVFLILVGIRLYCQINKMDSKYNTLKFELSNGSIIDTVLSSKNIYILHNDSINIQYKFDTLDRLISICIYSKIHFVKESYSGFSRYSIYNKDKNRYEVIYQ